MLQNHIVRQSSYHILIYFRKYQLFSETLLLIIHLLTSWISLAKVQRLHLCVHIVQILQNGQDFTKGSIQWSFTHFRTIYFYWYFLKFKLICQVGDLVKSGSLFILILLRESNKTCGSNFWKGRVFRGTFNQECRCLQKNFFNMF